MPRIKEDKVREDRIIMEIIVDAYSEEERAMGWYYYLEDKLRFPFKAKRIATRKTSPESCKFACYRIAWMRSLTKREQIMCNFTVDLTNELFEKRNEIGIWYYGKKEYFA